MKGHSEWKNLRGIMRWKYAVSEPYGGVQRFVLQGSVQKFAARSSSEEIRELIKFLDLEAPLLPLIDYANAIDDEDFHLVSRIVCGYCSRTFTPMDFYFTRTPCGTNMEAALSFIDYFASGVCVGLRVKLEVLPCIPPYLCGCEQVY